MKLLVVTTLEMQFLEVDRETGTLLCSVVLPCLIILQQNNFSISCVFLNCKNETLQKTQ